MKDFKKEINSRFMGDRTRTEFMADLITEEFTNQNLRIQALENVISLMQEAMMRMELSILTPKEGNEKPKRRRSKKDL
jgi:hypothetical protein